MANQNKKNGLEKALFILGIVTVFIALGKYLFFTENYNLDNYVSQAIPQATEFKQINREPFVYEGRDDGELIGYAVVEKASGYQSPIIMMVGIDLQGNILNSIVVDQQETPTFFKRLIDNSFFDQFLGRNIIDGFSDKTVQAVAHATISSNAVTKAINLGTFYVGKNYLHMNIPKLEYQVSFGKKEILIILLMATSVFATYQRKHKLRNFALLYSIIVLGFWYNSFITYGTIASMITGSIPQFSENTSWYILLVGAFGLILFTGKNLFCYWICPFGAVQEILAKISGFSSRPSSKIERYAKLLPGFFAWMALMLALLTGMPTAASFEPFATLFSQVGTNFQWALLPFVVLTSLIIFRFWCYYFCPVGYVLNLWVRLRTRGVRLWKRKENGKIISS